MLSTKNISYSIGNKTLVDSVTTEMHPGKINLVIGPNGAGKSTFIKLISGQLKPSSGRILFGDQSIEQYSLAALSKVRAVLSQNIELAFPLTVREVVIMGRYPHFSAKPTAKDLQAVEEAMALFDVTGMQDRNYLTLSGGEKQRVQFARVLAQIWYPVEHGCRYLVLDEPLTFLDIHYQFDFMEKLVSLLHQPDLLVIGVIHDLNLAARYAGHIILLNNGKVLAAGNKHEVLTADHITVAYHITPDIHVDNDRMYLLF